jgi:hypothetical protein
MREDLAAELLSMAAEDTRVRSELAADGSLFNGYHPRMREVHDQNASRLRDIWDEIGWPSRSRVGDEAARAAWVIVQHAIAHPELQRGALKAMKELVDSGDVDPIMVAMLEDRILAFEGRPQLYGTQFDWDAEGRMSPHPVDDVHLVDMRRQALGLPPLDDEIKRRRSEVDADPNQGQPGSWSRYQAVRLQWLKQTGWREWS